MYLGIDIGSSSSKVAIIDENKKIVALSVINLGTGTDAPKKALKNAMEQADITKKDVRYTIATGYGRVNFKAANKQITEITCHAKGASFLVNEVVTVIDIGGQDSKVIRLNEDGSVANFTMNDKCAAGTGRFIEVMARVLGCQLSDLSALSNKATKNIAISNVCTVFAESEAISRLASGESNANVARGAHIAIAKRVIGMCGRAGCAPKVVMTGGVALNSNFVDALSKELGYPVVVAPYTQKVGAIGAAVIAYETLNKK